MATTTNLGLNKPARTDNINVVTAINNNMDALDAAIGALPSGSNLQTEISGKADKVASPTNGDFAGLDGNGNLTDSGKKAADFALSSEVGTVPSGKTVQGQIDELNAEVGTVPSGETVQGQISDIESAIGTVPSGKTVQGQISEISTTVGSMIDDSSTANNKVWSAQKVNDLKSAIGSIEEFSWSNGYVNINGAIDGTAYDDRKHSSYLLCPPETSVVYVAETNHSGVLGISFYDKSKSFLSGVANNGNIGEPQTVISPKETFYCILSMKTAILQESYYIPAIRSLDYTARETNNNTDEISKINKKINNGKIGADVLPVDFPAAFSGSCPVNIYSDGYHYKTNFDANNFINTGGNVLYASPTAGSTGDGTISNPYNFGNAYSNAQNGDTIVLLSGFYTREKHMFSEIKKSINVVGIGTVSIAVGDLTTFTLVDGYTDVYLGQRSSGAYVFDISDAPNKVLPLTEVSSVEECASTVGSYYKDSSYYRVHPFTSGNPTGKLLIGVLNTPYEMPLSVSNENQSVNVYFENINVIGCPSGTRVHKANDSNGLTVCYNKINFILCGNGTYNSFNGYGGNIIMNECSVDGAYRDGFNYNASTVGGVSPRTCNVTEISCKGHNCGIGQSQETMNGSTSHLGCKVVRVNCEYSDCLGPNVADVQNGTQSVNLGCKSYASRATVQAQCNGFQCAEVGSEMWCMNCIAVGSDIDFNVASSGIMTIEKCAYETKAESVTETNNESVSTWMIRNLI